jgi:hypothetical protein
LSNLQQRGVSRKRPKKLTDCRYSTVAHMLELLNLTRKVSLADYALLIALKSASNNYAHKGIRITREDAGRCYDYAIKVAERRVTALLSAP